MKENYFWFSIYRSNWRPWICWHMRW